jgi:hypothetical protein
VKLRLLAVGARPQKNIRIFLDTGSVEASYQTPPYFLGKALPMHNYRFFQKYFFLIMVPFDFCKISK